MNDASGATLTTQTLHSGRVFSVVTDRVRLPNGRETTLDVVRHVRSVILIPMPDPEHVVLLRQYRYAIDQWIWELPAGNVEPGEDPNTAARRECGEEIGQVPTTIDRLAAFYPSPGYCDEQMIFFRLTGLTTPETAHAPDFDEVLEPHVLAIDAARQMVASGEIIDMKTALGLTLI